MTELIIKAEPKHYNAWFRQNESPLIDSLLMFNGLYCEKPNAKSSVTYLYKIMDSQMSMAKSIAIPNSGSLIYRRVEQILKLIDQERMITIKKSTLFKSEEGYPDFLMNLPARDPNLYLETTIIPIHFVSRLVEYKHLMPLELRKEFDSVTRELLSKQSSGLEKLTDPRERKTLYKWIYTFMRRYFPKYDPKAKKNGDTGKIKLIFENIGLPLSYATIKRIADESFQIAEEELKPKNKSL